MKIIRPVQKRDLQGLTDLASTMSLGVTSLSKKKAHLKVKIARSIAAFEEIGKKKITPEIFLFVLEDLETGEILGSSQIISKSGVNIDHYFYQIVHEPFQKKEAHLNPTQVTLLKPTKLKGGPSKLAGLYLHPLARKTGFGRILSFCRFHLIADFPRSFSPSVIAVMRGVIRKDLSSPFWDAVGSHFCKRSFQDAIEKDAETPEFHYNVVPDYPIYVNLLPKKAQEVVARTHPNTRAAAHLLMKNGFVDSGMVDLFDGGPILIAKKEDIHLIQNSRVVKVDAIQPRIVARQQWMASTTSADHRTTICNCQVEKNCAIITAETAKALEVVPGETLRLSEY